MANTQRARRFTTRMTQKGQVTIPAEVRQALGMAPRGLVDIYLADGEATIQPHKSVLEAGFASVKPGNVDLEDWPRVQEEAHEYIAERAAKRSGLRR